LANDVWSALMLPPLLTSVSAMRIAERRRRLCGVHSKLLMRWRYAEAQATVLLCDGFAVLDREQPDVDSKLGGNGSDWLVT